MSYVAAGSNLAVVPAGKTDFVMLAASQKLYQMKRYGVSGTSPQARNPPLSVSEAWNLFRWWWKEWKKVLSWTSSATEGNSPAPDGGYWQTGPLHDSAYDMARSDAKRFYTNVKLPATFTITGQMTSGSAMLSPDALKTFWYEVGRTAIALDATNSTPDYSSEIWGDMVNNAINLPGDVAHALVKGAWFTMDLVKYAAIGLLGLWLVMRERNRS